MPRIELTTEIPATPIRCFEVSLSVDAHQSSMFDSGERAIAGVTSGVMCLGDSVTWRARHFGIPFTMTSVIRLGRDVGGRPRADSVLDEAVGATERVVGRRPLHS